MGLFGNSANNETRAGAALSERTYIVVTSNIDNSPRWIVDLAMKKYGFVQSEFKRLKIDDQFEYMVSALMDEGWEPTGGVIFSGIYSYQAMIKRN